MFLRKRHVLAKADNKLKPKFQCQTLNCGNALFAAMRTNHFPQLQKDGNLYLHIDIRESMKVKKYHLKSGAKLIRFEFISEGPKGAFRKLIEFQETTDPGLFNLAFGDKDPITEGIDDLAVADNVDTEKNLATVVSCLCIS